MNKYKWIDRFKYRMDKEMSKGTISIIKLLSLAVLFVVVFVTMLIMLFKLKDGLFSAFWDSLATIINAYMPSSEDGEVAYIILNSIPAIVGLLFTSVLIGVISSAIEEKIEDLRKGNSKVLENDHIVVLGYNLGEHGLLKQLILAAGKEKRIIVIFTDCEKPEIEQDIHNNVEVPKNIEIICRNGDITNINDLRCCSIENARLIIINALNDNRRIKSILAVSALKKEYPQCKAGIVSCVTDEKHLLPKDKIERKNIIMLKTDDFMAKIIAHTATEPGLSIAFKELLNFEENELYFEKNQVFIGKSVLEISGMLEKASLVGIKRKGKIILNPGRDMIVEEDDRLILFEESQSSYRINRNIQKNIRDMELTKIRREEKGNLAVFGNNILLDTILDELPDDVNEIRIYTNDDVSYLKGKYSRLKLKIEKSPEQEDIEKIVSDISHIIILSDRRIDKEDADIDVILLLLKLKDIKERKDLNYNIAVELNMEGSYNVAVKNNKIDYIVSSNIASLLLGQMSANPELEDVFEELLSKRGNELYSKPISVFNLKTVHDYSYVGLKQIILSYGYTLLGYGHNDEIRLNPVLNERITFDENDRLIVLGRN